MVVENENGYANEGRNEETARKRGLKPRATECPHDKRHGQFRPFVT